MPNVSFGNHFDSFVNELVESGRYGTVSEVVRTGLRLLENQEKRSGLSSFIQEIQKGIDSGDAGALDMSEVKRKAREIKASRDS